MKPSAPTLLTLAAIGAGGVLAVLLVRRGEALIRDVGAGAAAFGEVVAYPATRLIDVAAGTILPDGSPVPESAGDTFGGALFKARVALFGLPSDFPESARERTPGLLGTWF